MGKIASPGKVRHIHEPACTRLNNELAANALRESVIHARVLPCLTGRVGIEFSELGTKLRGGRDQKRKSLGLVVEPT